MDSTGKVIHCKAAVCWGLNEPLVLEDVEVDPPEKGEVRVKIVASGVCHSDINGQTGIIPGNFPVILGHEGAGIVESIGEGVTTVQPGDHVLTIFIPQCRKCEVCRYPGRNMCDLCFVNTWCGGKMADGTKRFHCKGQEISNFIAVSSFSEYTVVSESNTCKINPKANLDSVCLLSCGVGTGYGAAINTAKVTPGSTCAVWGLGGIGLAAVMGCRNAGARKIIGIDINPDKEKLARIFGVTDFVNPKEHDRPMPEVLYEMTNGGAHFTFECAGNIHTLTDAFKSCHPAMGTTTVVGVVKPEDKLQIKPVELMRGRTIKGSLYGSWKSRDDIPKLVEQYLEKKILLDEFVTNKMPLAEANNAFEEMKKGKVIRTVLQNGGSS